MIGVGVAVVSTYKMSVSGLMEQVGLVQADFGASVSSEKLSGVVYETKSLFACNLAARVKGSMEFILGGDRQQAELAFKLGESRIICGAAMMYEGKVEEGTYEVIKGMGYMNKGYDFVIERAELDRTVCKGIPGESLDQKISEILDATTGRVYEIIWSEWQNVRAKRVEAQQKCLDAKW